MPSCPITVIRSSVALVALAVAIGCGRTEQIRTYPVAKLPAPHITATVTSGEATDRMLAAILPDGEKAWFFKVVAPISEIEKRADEIAKFLTSVRVAAGKPHPDWQLPDGWEERLGSEMRAATLVIPAEGKPLELSVSSLPWTGSAADLLSNVNRWRGQMQLAPIDTSGLADCTRELDVGGATMTIVDLVGNMQSSGMMPPFARGQGQFASTNGPSGARGDKSAPSRIDANLPAGHPPISAESSSRPAPESSQPAPLKFETPAGWQSQPVAGFRRAAFRIAADGHAADVTVIDFSADAPPMMSDPLANVNRWRGEVGLDPLTDESLSQATESIEIDGAPATYVEAIPDAAKSSESKAGRATVAAMVKHGDRLWFFKMTGDRELVLAERDRFKSFLKSVRFEPDGQANDGH